MKQAVQLIDLGTNRGYKEIWDMQEAMLAGKVKQKALNRQLQENGDHILIEPISNHLYLVEHNPVYTLGKSGHEENVLITAAERQQQGIEYFKINRGGDITFHGPGQLVGYPILDLEYFKTDLGWYLRSLEEVIIQTMATYGLKGERSPGETGVWLQANESGKERKICAMGIRCSRWITMHGFAFNVNTDLDYFNNIIPCGIRNKQVTSLQNELGHAVPISQVKERVLQAFETVFNVDVITNS